MTFKKKHFQVFINAIKYVTLKIYLVSFYVARKALVYQGRYIYYNLVISFLVVDFNVYKHKVYLLDPFSIIGQVNRYT